LAKARRSVSQQFNGIGTRAGFAGLVSDKTVFLIDRNVIMSSEKTNNSRRDFLVKSMALIPTVVIGGGSVGAIGVAASATAQASSAPSASGNATSSDWKPQFFNDREWLFINAAVARLIPADELGPGAKEAGVPEFIDRQLNTPYATGSIWYMQGPFNPDVPKEMGYQLPLVPKQIYNLGIADAEEWCQNQYHKSFAELSGEQQDEALGLWESGKAQFKQLPASLFFSYLLQNTREGFFSDPIHGGNKGMVGWTLINFPGARADFMDWVERGERYPFPPVSINGERA
jgi:gluconate 2-dehydrogenase gamma chain